MPGHRLRASTLETAPATELYAAFCIGAQVRSFVIHWWPGNIAFEIALHLSHRNGNGQHNSKLL